MQSVDERLTGLPPAGLPIRCKITGTVQGVFYRASAAQVARELGLRGFVRNLDDGSVEAVVDGDSAAVRNMLAWLWEGPPSAVVRGVVVEGWRQHVPEQFEIR